MRGHGHRSLTVADLEEAKLELAGHQAALKGLLSVTADNEEEMEALENLLASETRQVSWWEDRVKRAEKETKYTAAREAVQMKAGI